MCDSMPSTGRVYFVGAGPGAPDLITVRGARLIAEADVVVWPAAAVPAEVVRAHAGPRAELVDCSRWGHEHLLRLYRRAAAQRLTVARVVPGDAALWSGVQRQHDACRRLGLLVEIVPGVSALSAVVAATGRELAEPAVLLGQQDATTRGVPPGACLTGTDGVVAITTSAARTEALVARLRAGGRPDETPVVVGYKPSRPDELVLSTTLGELEGAVKRHRLWLPALFLVGHGPAAAVHVPPAVSVSNVSVSNVSASNGSASNGSASNGAGGRGLRHLPYRRRRRATQRST